MEFRRTLQEIATSFDYPVYATRAVFEPDNAVLVQAVSRKEPQRRHKVAVVVDRGVLDAWPALAGSVRRYVDAHPDNLALAAEPLVVAGGESVKNDPGELLAVQKWLHDLGIDRQSAVIIVGGGAVLDMAGYAAATTHRGVRVVRLPTTVLSQGDSGVGVKNGVNAFGKKNFLGTFAPPFAVINDLDVPRYLPLRDKMAGMAEAVKVSLVRDPRFFHWIIAQRRAASRARARPLVRWSKRCAGSSPRAHIRTAGDPFELGSASALSISAIGQLTGSRH